MNQLRQGDVLLLRVARRPAGVRKVVREDGRVVLAHGEATGHAHTIASPEAELYEAGGGDRYLEVREPVSLRHQEHEAIGLAPGVYRVRLQREYAPGAAGAGAGDPEDPRAITARLQREAQTRRVRD